MALTPRLELKQSQSLQMTPQLQQAIKLLQMSNADLSDFVEAELAENPMLEREDSNSSIDHDNSDAEFIEIAGKRDDQENLEAIDLNDNDHVNENQVNALDMENYDNVWDGEATILGADENFIASVGESPDWIKSSNNDANSRYESSINTLEQTVQQEVSLREHLKQQIQIDISNPTDRIIAMHLLELLDDAGRLAIDIQETANFLGCDSARINGVIEKLHAFDPPGIFAKDLVECWKIQLRERNRLTPAMSVLLQNVELLKLHDYENLSKLCGVDIADIKDMVDEIWSLNHKPAEAYENVITQPITPDVLMRPGPADSWIVELNNDTLPKVLVNNQYYSMIKTSVRTKKEKKYVTEKLQIANWLVKSLHQRATTILKVSTEIVQQQDAFFRNGVEFLKPLVLRDVAEEIDMHESTVSRVTSNKFINTPRGIYELKYFFTTSISSASGGAAHSAESVRYKIKSLINEESPGKILSDDKLVQLLKDNGIDIARRTVAKYRESMNIPSSVQRRKTKQTKKDEVI